MTRVWRPRLGMAPSPNETKVLHALMLTWSREGRHGSTLVEVHNEIVIPEPFRWAGDPRPDRLFGIWTPSASTVRDHLNRLEVKGHVRTWQRRRGVHPDAHKWYTPTKSAKLVMFDHLHPELIQ